MTQEFHPTTWIDQQRAAGASRGNVFSDILAAAEGIRHGQARHADYRSDRRVAEVQQIRREAAQHDADIPNGMRVHHPLGDDAVPTFGQMVQRWKSLP